MKIAQPTPQPEQPDGLTINLSGLTEKHARQMRKRVAGAVQQLTQHFFRLRAKEQYTQARQQRQATKIAVQNLVLRLHERLSPPAAVPAPLPLPRPGSPAS